MAAAPVEPKFDKKDPQYTVVQHSGFGYAGDGTFRRGLETRAVKTLADHRAVVKAGGLFFTGYGQASEWAEMAMYPPEAGGLTPQARGTFATAQIDGLAIYVPVRETAVVG